MVDKNWKWNGGLVGVNSFGFGGANVHAILRSHSKPKPSPAKDIVPRVVAISGRTRDAVNKVLEKVNNL